MRVIFSLYANEIRSISETYLCGDVPTYDLLMFLNINILIHSLLFIKKNVNSYKSGLILFEESQMSEAMLRVRPLTMVIKLDDEYFVEHCKSIQKNIHNINK